MTQAVPLVAHQLQCVVNQNILDGLYSSSKAWLIIFRYGGGETVSWSWSEHKGHSSQSDRL